MLDRIGAMSAQVQEREREIKHEDAKQRMKSLIEEAIVGASRQWIWETLTDVEGWSRWDLDVVQSSLHSPFSVGAKGCLIDRDGGRLVFEITDVQDRQQYSNEYMLPHWTRLHFTHTVIGSTQPHKVRFQARFCGPFAAYFRLRLGGGVLRTMKSALDNLSRLARDSLAP